MNNFGKMTASGFLPSSPSVEDLLDRLRQGHGGWSDSGLTAQAGASRGPDIGLSYAQTFLSPSGRIVLEHLLDMTLRMAPLPSHAMDSIEKAALAAAERKGQNAVVCAILKLVADGSSGPARESIFNKGE